MSDTFPTFGFPSLEELKTSHAAIFYDFDGVLTDNRVLVNEDGVESVFCNRSDGLAIGYFKSLGIHQAIISTESNPVVAARAAKLHIPFIHKLDSQALDKGIVLTNYARSNGINLESSIFIGNDINDLPALKRVGFPTCPSDAYPIVQNYVRDSIDKNGKGWISNVCGGKGVVRELLDILAPEGL